MKKVYKTLSLILLVGLCLLGIRANASHELGGQITYECLGGSKYLVTLTSHRSCTFNNTPYKVEIIASSSMCLFTDTIFMNMIGIEEGAPFCVLDSSTCSSGNYTTLKKAVFQGIIELEQCSDWIFTYDNCCRTSDIDNLTSVPINTFFETTLDNSFYPVNSSPQFSGESTFFVCENTPFIINNLARDPDGDSLHYSFIKTRGANGSQMGYTAGYSLGYPILTTSGTVDFDSTSGELSFTPLTVQGCFVTLLIEEYRNGQLIGSVTRDLYIYVRSCAINNPFLQGDSVQNVNGGTWSDSLTVEICVGDTLTFDLIGMDVDSGNSIAMTSDISSSIPEASLSITGNSPALGSFTWSPSTDNIGVHQFNIHLQDDACPINGYSDYTITVVVQGISTSSITVCKGDSIQLNAPGGTNFIWTPNTFLSNDTIANPVTFPDTTITYLLTTNDTGLCGPSNSITLTVVPGFDLTVSPDQNICLGGAADLYAIPDKAGSYSYLWTPKTELSNDTISNPYATTMLPVSYTVEVQSASGCIRYNTVQVIPTLQNVSSNPMASNSVICKGDSVLLTSNFNPGSCSDYLFEYIPYSPVPDTNIAIPVTWITPLPIGFDFKFYCGTYNQFHIDDQGIISLTIPTNTSCGGQKIPDPASNNNLIAFAWRCLNNGIPTYWTTGSSPFRKLIVDVDSMGQLSGGGPVTLQVILYETTNIIEIHTMAMPNNNYPLTMGIEGPAGTKGVDVPGRNLSKWSAFNDGVRFTPHDTTAASIGWYDEIGTLISGDANIYVSPDSSTTFSFEIDGNCQQQNTVSVHVSEPIISLSTPVCSQDSVQLSAQIIGLPRIMKKTCGISSGCSGADIVSSHYIGTDTTTNNQRFFPAIYGNYEKSLKHQILIHASDMIDAGMESGTLKDINFEVINVIGTSSYRNFHIRMGCTNLNELYSWQVGLDTVFYPKTVNLIQGWNSHNLDTQYDWDGESNLIIEVCFDNRDSVKTLNSQMTYTATDYNSVLYFGASTQNACFINSNPNPSNRRPNMRFGLCRDTVENIVNWMPDTFLTDNTISAPYANPPTETTYTVTIDNGYCLYTDSVTITPYNALSLAGTKVDALCGSSDGSAFVTVNNGTQPFTYLWDDSTAQTNASATGLDAGIYSVTVSELVGCSDSITIFINDSGAAVIDSISYADISCFNTADGFASAYASGGVFPYSYLWSDSLNQTNSSATGLAFGNHIISITDSAGCVTFDSIFIHEPAPLSLVLGKTDLNCFNNCVGIGSSLVSGGTLPYTYQWDDPSAQSSSTADSLCAGQVILVVTDSNGCSIYDSLVLNQPSNLVLSFTASNVTCFASSDGSISAMASGGVQPHIFAWSTGDSTANISGVSGGQYSISVIDSNGCVLSDTLLLNEPQLLLPNIIATDIDCNGNSNGSITSGVSGGTAPYTYAWSTGDSSSDIFGLGTGQYLLVLTDSNGCTASDSNSIAEPLALSINIISTDVSCTGDTSGAASVNTTGGTFPYSYLWSNGSTSSDNSGINAAVYFVTVTDDNGCTKLDSVNITEPLMPIGVTIFSVEPSCFGQCDGTVNTTVNGGTAPYNLVWSPALDEQNSCAGNYYLLITDIAGCTQSDTLELSEPSLLALSVSIDTAVVDSNNGGADLSIIGGTASFTYLWSNGATSEDLSNVTAGSYSVTVTDAGGCMDSIMVDIPEVLMIPNLNSPLNNPHFTVYPNPFTDLTTIIIDKGIMILNLEMVVFDAAGRQVASTKPLKPEHHIQFNCQQLNSGVYYLEVKNGSSSLGMQKLFILK